MAALVDSTAEIHSFGRFDKGTIRSRHSTSKRAGKLPACIRMFVRMVHNKLRSSRGDARDARVLRPAKVRR